MRALPSRLAAIGVLTSLVFALVLRNDAAQGMFGASGPDEAGALLLALAACLAGVALWTYGRHRQLAGLLFAGLLGVYICVVGATELTAIPPDGCLPASVKGQSIGCFDLLIPMDDPWLDSWELWALTLGGLMIAVGSALQLYAHRLSYPPPGQPIRA